MYRTPGGDPFSVRSNGAGFAEVKIGSDTTKNDPNAHAGSFGRGTVVKIPGHISASNQNTPHHIGGTLKIYSGSYAIHLFGSGSVGQRGSISGSGGGSITGFRNIIGVDTVGSTVSGYKTGSFGSVHTTGNISASGTITANKIETDNLVGHVGDANTGLKFAADTVTIEGNGVNIARFNTSNIELNKPIITDITASGNISASGVIISDKYQFSENTGNTYLEKTGTSGLTVKFGTSRFTGEITASGDISSSGTITGNDLRIKDQILRKNNNVIEAPSAGFSTTAITASIVSISGRIFTNLPAGTDNSVVVNSNGQLVTDEAQAAIFGSDPILTQVLEASAENLTAGQATTATNVIVTANNSTNESNFITFVDAGSGAKGIETDTALRYNPATNGITLGQISASSDISSSGTVQSTTGSFNHISIGNTQFNGNTFTTTGDIVLDTNTDIQLDAAGGNIEFKDAGTLQLTLDMDGTAGAQVIKLEVSGDDLIFKNQGGDSVLTLKSEGQTEIHSNVTASGNISSSGFIGAPIQLVTHAWYSAYAAADWGLDKLTNGDDNFGWADRAWDDAVDKADADAGNGNTGTFTNNDFNKGVRINHDVIDIELIGTLRPNSSVTQLNYYIYKGTPYAGGNTSTITFLASASSATTTTSRPNDIYITGSTGLQANKGDYLYIFANADLGSGNIKGSYTVTAKTRA